MTENLTEHYEHYITRNIKAVYTRRLAAPVLYLTLLAAVWFLFPLQDLLFPVHMEGYTDIVDSHRKGTVYISTDLTNLYFTGYTHTQWGQTTGYYYYTIIDDTCTFVLLSPRTSEEGLPFIEQTSICARIFRRGAAYRQLSEALSEDLSWTTSGIRGKISPYIISEPEFRSPFTTLLLLIFFATGLYALFTIIIYILYRIFPILSPPCRRLARFGKPRELLAQAEEELATLPQLATEDMFITEHYFIEIADSGIAVIPIQEIIWIYKYSTLHKFFWYHFNISYTLHITTNKHLYIQCPKNMKSDIDGIVDYLAEANHNIVVGFSEENRRKVQELKSPLINREKLVALFKRFKNWLQKKTK